MNFTDTVKLVLRTYKVLRETPCGYWVNQSYDNSPMGAAVILEQYKKWVSKNARKRLCYPTKTEAFRSFQIRKNRHLSILKAQIAIAEIAINLTEVQPVLPKPSEHCFSEI
jgi:hypothetical protein